MNNRLSILFVGAGLSAFSVLGGCQESVTYINVPADRADVAANDPDGSTVAALEAAALKAVVAEYKVKAPATILLPPGTRYANYAKVVGKVGAPFVLPEAASAETPVFEVRAVRARGAAATVEVVSKGELRPLMLTEVSLEYRTDFDGWGWRPRAVEARRILPAPAKHTAPAPAAKPAKPAKSAESDGKAVAKEPAPAAK